MAADVRPHHGAARRPDGGRRQHGVGGARGRGGRGDERGGARLPDARLADAIVADEGHCERGDDGEAARARAQ
eukprot:4097518-Prymnesium_polylepis.1